MEAVKREQMHPNVQQIAEVYRWRPFRRIRNLLEHLDTAYRQIDESEIERRKLTYIIRGQQSPPKTQVDAIVRRWDDE